MTARALTMLLILTGAALPLRAQPAHPAQAQLLADVSGIAPGQTFHLGVLMTMRPHWHTYWVNPGDAGQSTDVTFQLPEGFSAGELRFPVPTSFTQPGEIVGYGYEDQVLLITQVTAPQDLQPGAELPISADVRWLVCDPQRCIPGKAAVSLSLPIVAESTPANQELFQTWMDRLPQSDGKDAPQISWTHEGDLSGGETATYRATIEWPEAVSDVELFPTALPQLSNESIMSEHDGRTSRLTLTVRPFAGQTLETSELPAVVGYTNGAGERRGIATNVPLQPAQAAAAN